MIEAAEAAEEATEEEFVDPFGGKGEAGRDGVVIAPGEDEEEPETAKAEDETEDETEEDDEDEEDAPPPVKTRASDRIAKLTREKYDLARELATLRAAQPKEETKTAAEDPSAPKKPKASDFKFGPVDDDYLDARDAYVLETVKYENRKAAADAAEASAASEFDAKISAKFADGIKTIDKYHEVVVQGIQDGTWALSQVGALFLADSDAGAKLAYHLASNPEEAQEIAGLSEMQQIQRLTRLESTFLAETRPKTKTTPGAPAPLQKPRGSSGSFSVTPDTTDYAAFVRLVKSKQK